MTKMLRSYVALLFSFLLLGCNGNNNDSSTVIPPDISISGLQITPAVSSLPVGLSEQLKGEVILSDGQVLDVTTDDAVNWRSSDPAVATISSSGTDKGRVTGVSAGTVTITASGEANGQSFSATAEVTITHAVVAQLQITPAVSSLPVGLSEQLTGEVILSDGQVLDVTADDLVSWRSSDPAVATISSSGTDKGRVTGVSAGTVTITASGEANGQHFSATAEVTITDAVVTRVQITPAVSSLPVGLSEQLTGEALLSDGQVLDVTADDVVSWRSSDSAVATVSNSGADKGRVTGVSAGTVTITASGEANGQSFSATAEVTITHAVVTQLQITPAASSLPVGLSEQLTGEALLSNGQVLDVTADDVVSWHSSDPAVATISSSGADKGRVIGVSPGTVTITASGEANGQHFSATAKVTITKAVVAEVQITPTVSTLPAGWSERLTGKVTLSNGQVLDVTADDAVSWHSSDPAIATIHSSGPDKGMVTGVSAGTVTITASGEANGQHFSATAEVTITNLVVTQVQITPAVSSLQVGLSKQLKGEALLYDGHQSMLLLDVTADDAVSWSSSNPFVAIIYNSGPNKGLVVGMSAGTVTITASGEANGQHFSATAEVTITNLDVTQVQITPSFSSLPVGLSEQLKGEVMLSNGKELDVTADNAVSWSSSNPAIATISSSGPDKGRVTGVSAGTVTITASGEANGQSFSATAEVEVKPPLAFFTTPDTIGRNWNDADAYCKGLNPAARLPTKLELQNLFIQSSSITELGQPSDDMCDVHGWPLRGRCGGSTNLYWANDKEWKDWRWRTNMNNGTSFNQADDTESNHVACVREDI
ncbi:Ig-like domain-containing protein [Aeromonas caviae]|uniref:Ig-like domain-containing protein n=5 Tax=Aeromonas caviae TaxID=648 RepID=UPI0029DAB6C1|nr:Ig-like domain-containing protein [Aeromonas caviae]MDX7838880.1 Ig-like domain-containing protein [Aeromonas caviae]